MKAQDIFSYSFSAIKLRKLRTALTILGIVIGITAIVALLSITQGFSSTITGQLQQGLSTDTLIVVPGANALGGGGGNPGGGGGLGGGGIGGGSNINLYANYTDQIKAIPSISNDIVTSVAILQQPGYITNSSGSLVEVTITGVTFSAYRLAYPTTFVAANGNVPLNPSDTDVVVGARISDLRFNGTIFVNANDDVNVTTKVPFINATYIGQVVGVVGKIGGFSIGGPSDSSVYIPLAQAEKQFGTDQVASIIVKLKTSDSATVDKVSTAITNYFGGQVTVVSSTAVINLLQTVISTISLFLGGIAAISLLVAGIGIMNIMIVSLIERTREIGILKALGMKSRTVLTIFLCESAIIGLIGAVVGIALGWALANVVSLFLGKGGLIGGSSGFTIVPILTPEVLLGALGFGIGVSVIFALYPAWRASKLRPVDALRYE
jgi:putative ABC transport system permease protein